MLVTRTYSPSPLSLAKLPITLLYKNIKMLQNPPHYIGDLGERGVERPPEASEMYLRRSMRVTTPTTTLFSAVLPPPP